MEEIKRHCEKVIQILRSDYNTQLQYSGIIKKIYDVMLQMDYQSPILFEIDKIAKLSEGK